MSSNDAARRATEKNVHHVAIPTGAPQHQVRNFAKSGWKFSEGRAVVQGARLALDDGQPMPPITDRPRWQSVRPIYPPGMLSQDLPLSTNDDSPEVDQKVG